MSRVCLVYDCLFPWTVGGAERWYRNLAERLAADGHEVTYLTLRQWDVSAPPELPGVRVVPVGPRMDLYVDGRRRIAPPLVFGLGVFWHLLLHGRRYDVVHTASFPYFSLLAGALCRVLGGYRVVVDWVEFWTRAYWDGYLGRLGVVGWYVQKLCTLVPQRSFSFAALVAGRVSAVSSRRRVHVLRGLYNGPFAGDSTVRSPLPASDPPVAMFAGRHIPEKRVPDLVPALAVARSSVPGLSLSIFGDGPDFDAVSAAIASCDLGDAVVQHGFVQGDAVDTALRSAACLVLPSVRVGYGLIVVVAAALGCPSVVVSDPDNAALELVVDGVNGVVAPSSSAADLGAAIVRAVSAGAALRQSTTEWYAANAVSLSLEASLDAVAASYR